MSGGLNCYPGSDVLINNYNIRDKELLEKLETQKVMVKLLSLDTNSSLTVERVKNSGNPFK